MDERSRSFLSRITGLLLLLLVIAHESSGLFYQLKQPNLYNRKVVGASTYLKSSYLDELGSFKAEKKLLVGLTTDAWNIGQKKYKEFLAVHKMAKLLQKSGYACVEVPMWEITQGPNYDELQQLLESFWIPDVTIKNNLLLNFDLVVVPDPTLAKYLVEAYHEKEAKVQKKKAYYSKLLKQPWGVMDSFPPKERYEWQRIKQLSQQKWGVRKFPPVAAVGEDTYKRLKNHGEVDYFSYGIEDFALYLPWELVPSRRVLVLRYKNRFDTLVQSLVMKGVNVTSAYPVTWSKRQWNSQEERMAKEVDVVYFHESHAVKEWSDRLGHLDKVSVAVCHDEEVGRTAKEQGFADVFYAKQASAAGLTSAVTSALEFARSSELMNAPSKKK